MLHDYIGLALPVVLLFVGSSLTALLNSPEVKAATTALKYKLDAEADLLIAQGMHSKNIVVRVLVEEAMAYAEQHEANLLQSYKSKSDFVIAKVSSDPRFAALGVPLEALNGIIESVYEELFAHIAPPAPPAK